MRFLTEIESVRDVGCNPADDAARFGDVTPSPRSAEILLVLNRILDAECETPAAGA